MRRILSAIVLFIAIILEIPYVYAYEYIPYTGDGIIRASSVTLTDSDGERINSLTPGETVTASIRVRPGSGSLTGTEKVSLIIASYSDGFFEDMNTLAKTITSAEVLTASIIVPDVNPGIRVFLWDEATGGINARPLFKMGEFNTDTSEVEQITVGGEPIVDFSADVYEYDVMVNAGYMCWPDIMVYTSDAMTNVKAEYKGNFPLSKPIHQYINSNVPAEGISETATAVITAGNKTYRINIRQEVPQITDVYVKHWASATSAEDEYEYWSESQAKVSYDIQNPVWSADAPGPNVENTNPSDGAQNNYETQLKYYITSADDLEGYSPVFSDRTAWVSYDICPELLGSQQILLPNSNNYVVKGVPDYCTFTIDRSARIYVYAGSTTSFDETWKLAYNKMYSKNSSGTYYTMVRYFSTGKTSNSSNDNLMMYYKDFEVDPGSKCTITMPSGSSPYRTYIQYKDTDFVTNAVYRDGEGTTEIDTVYFGKPFYRLGENGDYSRFASAGSNKMPALGTGNIMYGSSLFSNKPEAVPVEFFDDSLEGAVALRLKYSGTSTNMQGVTNIEFDLSAPAQVYVFTNISSSLEYLKNNCFTESDGWHVLGGEDELAIKYKTNNDGSAFSTLYKNSSFTKSFYTENGDITHVNIDFTGMNASGSGASLNSKAQIVVVIKPLDMN